jgi:hypothetical protein
MSSYDYATAEKVKTRVMIMSDTYGGTHIDAAGFWDGDFKLFDAPPPDIDLLIHCGNFSKDTKSMNTTLQAISMLPGRMKLIIPGSEDVPLPSNGAEPADPFETFAMALTYWEARISSNGGMVEANNEPKDLVFLNEGIHTVRLSNGAILNVYASSYSLSENELTPFTYSRRLDRLNITEDVRRWRRHVVEDNVIPTSPYMDIVVTRGPPHGTLDTFQWEKLDIDHVEADRGCKSLGIAISRVRPRFHCFGKTPNAYGARQVFWSDDDMGRGFESCVKLIVQNYYPKRGLECLPGTHMGRNMTYMVNATMRRDCYQQSRKTVGRPWIFDYWFEKDLSGHR